MKPVDSRTSRLATIGTLFVLMLIGYLGHSTHWSIPGGNSPVSRDELSVAPPAPARAGVDLRCIEFPSAAAVRKSGITTVALQIRPLIETVTANGVVTYDQRLISRVSTRVSGTVWSVEKRWGDSVKKGEVLAVVEAVEIGRLKADFLNQLALTETRAEALKLLEMSNASIPNSRIREAELQLREARINLLNAEQTLVNVGIPLHMETFEPLDDSRRARRIQFLGLPEAVTKGLDPDETTTNLVPIIAPFDGVVIGRDVGVGEWTEPSRQLFDIADLRSMWIKLDVRKEDAAKIRLDQAVTFHGDGAVEEITCRISWISTEVNEETRTLQVRAEFANPVVGEGSIVDHRLVRANTFGVAQIQIREKPAAVAVPMDCIQTMSDGALIFVRESDQTFRATPVKIGLRDGAFVEVLHELPMTTEVACRGSHVLKSQYLLNLAGGTE